MNYVATTTEETSKLATYRVYDDISDATDIVREFAMIKTPAFIFARNMLACKCTPLIHLVENFKELACTTISGTSYVV
jgi:hypothetical protein